MEFPALLLALCVIAVAGGAAALLTAHQARHRLGGLTVMAAGPVVGLVALGPHRTGAVVAAALSALTIGARAVRSVAVTTAGPARWARDRQVLLDRMEAWTTRRSTGAAMAALVTLALLLSLTLPGQ